MSGGKIVVKNKGLGSQTVLGLTLHLLSRLALSWSKLCGLSLVIWLV